MDNHLACKILFAPQNKYKNKFSLTPKATSIENAITYEMVS